MNKDDKARIIALLNDVKPDEVRKALKGEFAELVNELGNAVNRECNQRLVADDACEKLAKARDVLRPFGKLLKEWLT